ncbi:MAG: hypothetical protein ACXITV_01920 [Luteibaculaceae bacterium]
MKSLSHLFLAGVLLFGSVACSKDKKEDEPAPPPQRNEVRAFNDAVEMTHAYVVAYTEELFLDDEEYLYFELVLSSRNIGMRWIAAEADFDLDELFLGSGDSFVSIPFAVKSSVFSSIEGTYNSLNSATNPNRLMGSDAVLFWKYNPSITGFQNTLDFLSESVNSLMVMQLTGSINLNNATAPIFVEGFLSYDGLSSPIPFVYRGTANILSTDVDPNDFL